MNLLSCTCLYSISLLGRGRPPLVSLFAERKEKGQNLRRKTSTPSFQNQSGLLCKIFITFVLSIDVKVLTSPGWAKKINFSSNIGEKGAQPGCNWAGARAPRTVCLWIINSGAQPAIFKIRGGFL